MLNKSDDDDEASGAVDMTAILGELEKVTREELDFRIEAEHTKLFHELCIEDETVVSCPKIIDELTTERILTMTYVDGYSISHKERLEQDGYDCNEIGKALANNYVQWDGVLLSARSVRRFTDHFWNIADQRFIKWLGAELTEETEYLGRPCGLYHAQPGIITFTYHCDMIIDDETGICLGYTANELLKGAVFGRNGDGRIRISIGDYDIGGTEMNFYCTEFETENISFDIPGI